VLRNGRGPNDCFGIKPRPGALRHQ
jgi:hypothetical protein